MRWHAWARIARESQVRCVRPLLRFMATTDKARIQLLYKLPQRLWRLFRSYPEYAGFWPATYPLQIQRKGIYLDV